MNNIFDVFLVITAILELEALKTAGEVLKISFKDSPRKSGGYLTILSVTLAGGKSMVLHNLGASLEQSQEAAARKALDEINRKRGKGDEEESEEESDEDDDSDD